MMIKLYNFRSRVQISGLIEKRKLPKLTTDALLQCKPENLTKEDDLFRQEHIRPEAPGPPGGGTA